MNFRKNIIIALVGLVSVPASAQYTISGQIKNHGGRILLLARTETGACDTLGNHISADGVFCFKGNVQTPLSAEIEAVNTRLRFPIFLENAVFEVMADTKKPADYEVKGGGALQQLRNEFRKTELALAHEQDSLRRFYQKEYANDDFMAGMQIKGLRDQYAELYDQAEDEFIRKHDNLVSAGLIAWRYKTLVRNKKLVAKYKLLGEEARRSIQGRWLKPYVDKVARIVVGGIAPDLTMQTPEGGMLSIYGVKAKVKILDFWASWCGPCRAENPNVKRIYERYKSKGLEIISISLDAKLESWQKAIREDDLPWKHMSDLKGWGSVVTDVYGIFAIPHLFVLDSENRIIAEGLRGEELEKCVKEALEQE